MNLETKQFLKIIDAQSAFVIANLKLCYRYIIALEKYFIFLIFFLSYSSHKSPSKL